MLEAEFWVAIAFALFLGVLGYFGAHKRLVKAIDDRRNRIKSELDDACRLKEEAKALLEGYQRRRQEVEREAQAIIAGAQAESERLAAEAVAKVEDFVARHTKVAQDKIAASGATPYLSTKLVTGRFFMERVLPETAAQLSRITAGAASVMELPAEAF